MYAIEGCVVFRVPVLDDRFRGFLDPAHEIDVEPGILEPEPQGIPIARPAVPALRVVLTERHHPDRLGCGGLRHGDTLHEQSHQKRLKRFPRHPMLPWPDYGKFEMLETYTPGGDW